jgi:hypothetical protein
MLQVGGLLRTTGMRNRDLIDQIGDGRPENPPEAFYREMNHRQLLPERQPNTRLELHAQAIDQLRTSHVSM